MDAATVERLHASVPLLSRCFALPRDRAILAANDPRLAALAGRLWEAAADPGPTPIRFEVTVRTGPAPEPEAERLLVWTRTQAGWDVRLAGLLAVRIGFSPPAVTGTVSRGLVRADPALAARYLLEAPAAVLLARRAWQVLHAGAVLGPGGAVVIRGGAGAGKSTLVAAAWRAGLAVLADESLLVARDDPDALAASVRDLTLREDAASLLGLLQRTQPAFSGGEPKRRADLWPSSSPSVRAARRVATLLLGDRDRTPAHLVPLAPAEFLKEFAAGEIPQEREAGDPDPVARAWAASRGFRLEGARDLPGAVATLARFVQ